MRSTVSLSIIAYKGTNNSGKGTGKTAPKLKNPERELLRSLQQAETGRRKEIAQPGNNLQKPRQTPGFQSEFRFVMWIYQEKPFGNRPQSRPGSQPPEFPDGDPGIANFKQSCDFPRCFPGQPQRPGIERSGQQVEPGTMRGKAADRHLLMAAERHSPGRISHE